jgi:hypothetical protein
MRTTIGAVAVALAAAVAGGGCARLAHRVDELLG